jgi:membrane protein YdbS with pleckstrin-like domain
MFILEQQEQILKVVRRHWFLMLSVTVMLLALALAPIFLYDFLTAQFLPLDQSLRGFLVSFVADFGAFIYSIWLLVLWVMFFIEWTDYYLDMLVITNKRIIDVEQKGFFNREVTSFPYDQIQDITVDTVGVVKTLLKFSDIHIQTAGHNHEIIVKDADGAEEAKSLILRLSEQARAK